MMRSLERLPQSVIAVSVGRGISILGDQIALYALLFRAKSEIGHMGVALVILAGTVPLVLLAPWAGQLVDTVRTLPILLITLCTQLALELTHKKPPAAHHRCLTRNLRQGTGVAKPTPWSFQ